MGRPVVAVAASRLAPGRVTSWADGAEGTQWQYLDGLRRAGVVPALVAPAAGEAPGEVVAPFAGLVLTGGGDVDPLAYGAEPHPSVYGIDAERDRREIELARHALVAGLPLLAICRGLQVLDVALGGKLVQHLDAHAGGVAHRVPSGIPWEDRVPSGIPWEDRVPSGIPWEDRVPSGSGRQAEHPVTVRPGSRLAAAIGGAAELERCVSIHHQAVDEVASGLVVTARSADGVVEALETPPTGAWCLAVQWHPERSAATDPLQQALFDAFAGACRCAWS